MTMNTLTDEQIINTFDEHFGGDDLDVPEAGKIAFAFSPPPTTTP